MYPPGSSPPGSSSENGWICYRTESSFCSVNEVLGVAGFDNALLCFARLGSLQSITSSGAGLTLGHTKVLRHYSLPNAPGELAALTAPTTS